MGRSFLLRFLLGLAVGDRYEELKEDPALWGEGFQVVSLPCRQRESFDFHRCCASHSIDSSQLEGCFRTQSAGGIKYAQEHCCNDREAVLMANSLNMNFLHFAECLSNCTCINQDLPPDCGCERRYVSRALQVAPLPSEWRSEFSAWLLGRRPLLDADWKRNTSLRWCHQENLRHAARVLEHLLGSPQMAVAPEVGQRFEGPHQRIPLAHAFHQRIARMQKRRNAAEVRRLFRPAVLQSATPREAGSVHVAMIASIGQPVYGRQALATIRSALFHAHLLPLHFHIFVDTAGQEDVAHVLAEVLEPELLARASAVDYYGPKHLKRIWPLLRRHVPLGCMAGEHLSGWSGVYGAPGWMRLFAEEVFAGQEIDHLIWVDAGDFVFFSDPATLLHEHIRVTEMKPGTVATHPKGSPWALQVFSFKLMRQAQWTKVVSKLIRVEWQTNRTGPAGGSREALCFMGEGMFMILLSQHHPELFGTISQEWAHEPRLPFFTGNLMMPWYLGGFSDAPEIWFNREHPGLVDFTEAFTFCPTFDEIMIHNLAVSPMTYPIFVVEVAQVLHRARLEFEYMAMDGAYAEAPAFGRQVYRCGKPVLGMHLIRQFHVDVPWSIRLLDFWSKAQGLWGPKRSVKRDLPRRLDIVE